MSNYVKATNFAVKDGLASGNPSKIIKGTEIDTEYNAIASAISSKADLNSPTFTGTPAGPTASSGTNTTQLATTAFVTTAIAAATAALVPSGMIMIWSGSVGSIPSGWVLCNGSNSTPDLRDKFIVGAGSTYAVGGTGGSANAVVVSHTHTATVTDPGHAHGYTRYGDYRFKVEVLLLVGLVQLLNKLLQLQLVSLLLTAQKVYQATTLTYHRTMLFATL